MAPPLTTAPTASTPAADASECASGYACEALEGQEGSFCFPETDACTCDGTNTDLQRGCQKGWPVDGLGADYTCFGLQACTPSGWSECVMAGEVCDSLDNDCDGLADEGFLDEEGAYTADESCGGCGNDCTCSSSLAERVSVMALSTRRFARSVRAQLLRPQHQPKRRVRCCDPVPTDFPEPGGVDANCDGLDGEKDNGVFVSKPGLTTTSAP